MFLLESAVPVIEIGVVVLVALLLGIIFTRLKLSSSIGYILAGVVLGPLGFNYLVPNQGIAPFFGDIGILMLMFYLGLELSIKKFKETGAVAFVLTAVDMLAAFVIGFAVAKAFGFSMLESIVIGSLLPMASTVIIVKFIMERNIFQLPESRIAISSLIIEDFVGILVLIFLSTLSSQQSINSVVLNGVLFVIAAFFIVRKLSAFILRFVSEEKQATPLALYAIAVGIVVGYVGVLFNLSPILGAYFAGFALAETIYHEKIKKQLGLFREFFIMFFFVNFGSLILFPNSPVLFMVLAVMLVLYLVGKLIVSGIFGTAIGLSPASSISIGTLLIPVGEFSLIIAGAAAPLLGAKAPVIAGLAFLLVITTTLIGPFLYNRRENLQQLFMRLYPKKVQAALARTTRSASSLEMHFSHGLIQPEYYSTLKNLFWNLVIAFAVVYLAFLIDRQVSFDFIPTLPKGLAIAVITLPLILWPMHKFTEELRFLVKKIASDLWGTKQKAFTQQVSDLFVSGLLTAIALFFAVFFWYYSGLDRAFAIIPFLYAFLALTYFSKSLYALFEKYETVEAVLNEAGEEQHDFLKLSREFDTRTKHFTELNAERQRVKQQVQEALSTGDLGSARKALSAFKKKEDVIMRRVNASHPTKIPAFISLRKKQKHVETPGKKHLASYLMKKAGGLKEKLAKKKK